MENIGIVISSAISRTDLINTSPRIAGEVVLFGYFGEEEFTSKTMNQKELFERMRHEKELPTTAQPSPGAVSQVIDEAIEKFDKLVVIMPHEKLSGTYQNCVNVISEKDRSSDIFTIATNSIAVSELAVATKAIELIEQGEKFVNICDELIKYNSNLITYAYPGSTKHLRKSGRISNGQALILGALHIRVQIKCAGDAPFSDGKGRGEKFVLRNIEEELAKVNVEHIYYSSLEESEKLRKALFKMFEKNGYNYTHTYDADVIPCVHFGENTLGFTVVCK